VEAGAEFAAVARENFRRNGMEGRIELINAEAAEALLRLTAASEVFDMVFLDGDKGNYGRLFDPLFALLKPGGLMIVDDVFCNGDSLNEIPNSDKGHGVQALLRRVAALPDHPRVVLPYGNGQLLLLKSA
jgi:caffeoyl-CoA O-methyltransferase